MGFKTIPVDISDINTAENKITDIGKRLAKALQNELSDFGFILSEDGLHVVDDTGLGFAFLYRGVDVVDISGYLGISDATKTHNAGDVYTTGSNCSAEIARGNTLNTTATIYLRVLTSKTGAFIAVGSSTNESVTSGFLFNLYYTKPTVGDKQIWGGSATRYAAKVETNGYYSWRTFISITSTSSASFPYNSTTLVKFPNIMDGGFVDDLYLALCINVPDFGNIVECTAEGKTLDLFRSAGSGGQYEYLAVEV